MAAMQGELAQLKADQACSKLTLSAATQRVEQVHQAVSQEVRRHEETEVDGEYNAPPNGTILRLHVNEVPVAIAEVKKVVQEQWLIGIVDSDQWTLEGPAEGHRFVLKFTAFPKTASMHLNKATKILQPERPGDNWTELWIPKDGSSYKLFVNRDASEQMQRLQLLQRKVREACKELYPTLA
eukprot:4472946-Karenia_brevis.AAC.1